MKPPLRLSIDELFMLEEALVALRSSEFTVDAAKTIQLQTKLNEERMILESHRCTEYRHDCPICNRANA